MNYIHYLQFISYIDSDVELLTLKDLQGITGLKALRVSILYNNSDGINESKAVKLIKEIKSKLKNLTILRVSGEQKMIQCIF